MASVGPSFKQLIDTEAVVGLAEALSVVLVARLNDALRDTIALEAKRWRTEALDILEAFRQQIQCRSDDSGIKHGDSSNTSAPNDDPCHASALSETSSNLSALSLPLSSFRRITSLEQRLAANIFAARYAEHNSTKEAKAQPHKGTHSNESCQSKQKRIPFDPLIPDEPANISRPPCEVPANDCDDSPTPKTRYASGRVYGSPSSSSSGAHDNPTSSSNGLDFARTSLERVPSLGSVDSECLAKNDFRRDDSRGVCSIDSRRSQSSPTSSKGLARWKNEAWRFHGERSPAANEARGLARRIVPNMLKALGIIPWSRTLVKLSKLYQFAIFCCLIGSAVNIMTRSRVGYLQEANENVFAVHVDDVLVIGTFLSFSAALWKNDALNDSSWLVEAYLSRAGRLEDANKPFGLQLAIMSLIWSVCVGSRLYANDLALSSIDFSFAFSFMVLLALCFYLYRMCYCLSIIVDYFCCYMQENTDFEKALEDFFLLHCTLRTACASLQSCFVFLQLTATVVLLFCSASIYFGAMSTKWGVVKLLPNLFCLMALLQLSVRASLVSDLCARVPMLVNSATGKLSIERMHVVEYIVHCQTGFYIFEVRLNTAMILKLFYVAFVGWCGLLTQGLEIRA